MNRKQQQYQQEVVPFLKEKYGKQNDMAVAKLVKIKVNVGIGSEAGNRNEIVESVSKQLADITGQKPHQRPARKSIATFAIRQGDPIGVAVTLRGERMWVFLDKLVSIVLPQVKDFRGVSDTAFDQDGNYSLGLNEQIVFPEIVYDEIDKIRGLQITFTIRSSEGKEESYDLLQKLGMPFRKEE